MVLTAFISVFTLVFVPVPKNKDLRDLKKCQSSSIHFSHDETEKLKRYFKETQDQISPSHLLFQHLEHPSNLLQGYCLFSFPAIFPVLAAKCSI